MSRRPTTQTGKLAHAVRTYGRTADRYAGRTRDLMLCEVARFARYLPQGAVVLDAGCGPGRDLVRFDAAGLHPVGVDLTPEFARMAAQAVPGRPVTVADLRALPLASGTFDAVWASASLVHLEPREAGRALAELRRVARSGALAYVSVKTGPTGWRKRADGTARWFQGWSHEELGCAVEAAGWRLRRLSVSEKWVEAYAVAGS